jgi:hypothetical protein
MLIISNAETQQLHKEISYILGTMLIQNGKIGFLEQMQNVLELLPYITQYILEQCAEDGFVEDVYLHTEKWIINNKEIMDKEGVPHEADYVKVAGEWLNKRDFAEVLEGYGTAEEIEEYIECGDKSDFYGDELYTEHFSRWLQSKQD